MTFWKKFFGEIILFTHLVFVYESVITFHKKVSGIFFFYWLFITIGRFSKIEFGGRKMIFGHYHNLQFFMGGQIGGQQIFQCKYEFFFCFFFKSLTREKKWPRFERFLQKYRDDTKFRENARPFKNSFVFHFRILRAKTIFFFNILYRTVLL